MHATLTLPCYPLLTLFLIQASSALCFQLPSPPLHLLLASSGSTTVGRPRSPSGSAALSSHLGGHWNVSWKATGMPFGALLLLLPLLPLMAHTHGQRLPRRAVHSLARFVGRNGVAHENVKVTGTTHPPSGSNGFGQQGPEGREPHPLPVARPLRPNAY